MSITLFILTILFALFYKYVKYRQSYWKRKGMQGPDPTFLLGHFFNVFLQKEASAYDIDRVYRQYKEKHGVIGVYQFLKPSLLVLDTSIAREILVKNFKSFHLNGFEKILNEESDPLLAFNPFFLTGDAWKDKRNEITPAFSPSRIKTMYPLLKSVCTKMTEYLETKAEIGETLEGRDLCSRFTCDVVTKCIFAADAQCFDTKTPEIREQAKKVLGSGFLTILKIMVMEMFPAFMKKFHIGLVPKETEAFFRDLMRQATEYRVNNNIDSQDYLGFLLQMKKKKGLSDLEVAASGITFFLDGLETSAIGISYILFEIANNKQVQLKLRDEINEAFAKHGTLDYETLVHLPYLDQVFHESLRLHPPFAGTSRECTENIEINVGKDKKFLVEKGTSMLIPIWSFHYDPNIYEEPEKFKPERFDDGVIKDYKDKGQWLVFGDGPRTCLGQRFAKAQSKSCVATIVKNFEITVNEKTVTPLRLDPKEFFGTSLGGIWLDFKKINN